MMYLSEINEYEKNRILSLHKTYAWFSNLTENEQENINEIIFFIKKNLNFQKNVHLNHLTQLKKHEKSRYINHVEETYVLKFFSDNKLIIENYKKTIRNIVNENIDDFSTRIDRFNSFLCDSLLNINNFLTEQNYNSSYNVYDAIGSFARGVKSGYNQVASYAKNKLQTAADYINAKGINWVFENLRTALLSGIGTAIQIALAFTQIGAIATEVAWAIMTLYDAYQLIINRKPGSLSNLIIDLICLLTAGTLGKIFKNYVNLGANNIISVLKSFLSGGLGKYINPIVRVIEAGASKLSGFLQQARTIMINKMRINWISNLITPIITFFQKLVAALRTHFGTAIAATAAPIIRAGVQLEGKINSQIFSKLAELGPNELAKYGVGVVEKSILKAAKYEAEQHLKNEPIMNALEYLDKKFGTKIGNLYAAYVGANQLISTRNKIANTSVSLEDINADALRNKNYLEKSQKNASLIKNLN